MEPNWQTQTGCVESTPYLTDWLLQVVSPDVDMSQVGVEFHSLSQSQQSLCPDVVPADRQPDGRVFEWVKKEKGVWLYPQWKCAELTLSDRSPVRIAPCPGTQLPHLQAYWKTGRRCPGSGSSSAPQPNGKHHCNPHRYCRITTQNHE